MISTIFGLHFPDPVIERGCVGHYCARKVSSKVVWVASVTKVDSSTLSDQSESQNPKIPDSQLFTSFDWVDTKRRLRLPYKK